MWRHLQETSFFTEPFELHIERKNRELQQIQISFFLQMEKKLRCSFLIRLSSLHITKLNAA